MKMRLFTLALLAAAACIALAGNRKLSASTQLVLASSERPSQVEAFIATDGTADLAALRRLGVRIGSRFSGFVTATVPTHAIGAVAALPGVRLVQCAAGGYLDTDLMPGEVRADSVNAGSQIGLPSDYDGSGVVIGIIDSGIDYNHLAFLDSAGHSRISAVYAPYEQGGTPLVLDGDTLPGSQFDSTAVAGLTSFCSSDHGSHCLAIAGGSRVESYRGIAPGAELAAVDLSGHVLTDVTLANGVKFLAAYARSVGKRLVVSVSGGPYYGPHDGSSLACQAYSQLIDSQDVVIVNSAGNYGKTRGHHAIAFGADSVARPRGGFVMGAAKQGYVTHGTFDAWSTSADTLGVKFLLIDTSLDSIVWQSPVLTSSTLIYCGSQYHSSENYDPTLTAFLTGSLSLQVAWGANGHANALVNAYLRSPSADNARYQMALQYCTAAAARVDTWTTGRDIILGRAPLGPYTFTAGVSDGAVNDIATARGVITVGNYVMRNTFTTLSGQQMRYPSLVPGYIAGTSSYGTDLNGTSHPIVAAPGSYIVSALNSNSSLAYGASSEVSVFATHNSHTSRTNYWGAMEGTSMATPCVAGIAALWLQASPRLSAAQLRATLMATALRDGMVGNSRNYGAGKVNAMGYFAACCQPGDINHDGTLDASDVTALVAMLLGQAEADPFADLNGDHATDAADLSALIALLLGAQQQPLCP